MTAIRSIEWQRISGLSSLSLVTRRGPSLSNAILIWVALMCMMALIVMAKSLATTKNNSRVGISVVTTIFRFPRQPIDCSEQLMVKNVHHLSASHRDVVVLADSEGVCANLSRIQLTNVRCVLHSCMNMQFKRPEVPCLLRQADRYATEEFLVFTNSDIVLNGIDKAVEQALEIVRDNFVLVGQRIDSDMQYFCGDCSKNLIRSLNQLAGAFHPPTGVDYFVYKKGTLPLREMPPFLLGVWRWDNWLLDRVITHGGYKVIDCTFQIQAVHFRESLGHPNRNGASYNLALYQSYYSEQSWSPNYPVRNGQIDCTTMQLIYSGRIITRKPCIS